MNREVEDYLMLSAIQHFAFCPRQWGLIHLEQQWKDNLLTVEGNLLHQRCHDDALVEKRGDLLISRGMRVISHQLQVTGVCDVVGFYRDDSGVPLFGRAGTWRPVPVEYKRGKPKEHDGDVLQLCGQAMCLEEMLLCQIPEGFLFYGEPRRRLRIPFDEQVRSRTRAVIEDMWKYQRSGTTPKTKPSPRCKACSLAELCLPKLQGVKSVSNYVEAHVKEAEE